MLYVAGQILIWMALAFILGLAVGWFVWGYRSKAEAARADEEVQCQLGAARQEVEQGKVQVVELLALRARDADTIARLQALQADPRATVTLQARIDELEARLAASTEERSEAEERAGAAEEILETHEDWEPVGPIPGLEQAQATLGKPIVIDDLKMVEGIGPRIEEILHRAGINSWARLAATTPAQLRSLLAAAGDEYSVHDPTTWPQQAVLALGGHWHSLRTLQDNLRAGRV
jgi:predicted flap endonuclease-1-like 5' DNA nuclease